jgi:hypothetical protein
MNHLIQRLFQAFRIRLFLNIVLWLVVAYQLYFSNKTNTNFWIIYTARTVSLVSIMVFTYLNNLVLIPLFLARGRAIVYVSFACLLVIVYGLGYSLFIERFVWHYPNIHLYEIVLFSVSAPAKWSFGAILAASIEYSIVYGIWLFVLTMAWYMHDHARQRKAMLLAQQQQTETELNFLKAQINPHFLFNTLNNLYALARKKSDQSPEAILKLSAILRYLLYDSNTPTVNSRQEQEVIEAYIEIEQLRLEKDQELEVSISCDEPRQIPPLLWLPILENVFKHGIRTIGPAGKASFQFVIANNKLRICSSNREKQALPVEKDLPGIGLSNLRKRLELLYPGKHRIITARDHDEYTAEVIIDLA